MAGLIFADDLAAWQRWQRSRHRLRMLRDLVRRPAPPVLRLLVRGTEPRVLFALEATTPTALASIADPLSHLDGVPVAVLVPQGVSPELSGEWHETTLGATDDPPPRLRSLRAIVATGHFLAAGGVAYRWAGATGARFFVVQHGLLTPHAPPLPPGAHVLAFSDRDLGFWRSGRTDVTGEAVGSQLLWKAAASGARTACAGREPVFLGQLHGAELPRRVAARTAEDFCLRTGALYRPHPAETDALSRRQHVRWRSRGIRFAGSPLLDAARPVVSVFSTGVLEAAAAGIPSWVTCLRPPAWVGEFWDRYAMSRWGGDPTPAPARPSIEPALVVARRVRTALEGAR